MQINFFLRNFPAQDPALKLFTGNKIGQGKVFQLKHLNQRDGNPPKKSSDFGFLYQRTKFYDYEDFVKGADTNFLTS